METEDQEGLSQTEVEELLDLWVDRPDLFAEHVFGVRLAPHQREILLAIARNKRVSVTSGHKIGKGLIGAIAVWWWVTTRYRGKAIIWLPTGRQAQDGNYPEVIQLLNTARSRGFDLGVVGTESTSASNGIHIEGGGRIFCLSADAKSETKAGYSGAVFVWLDEATGIPDGIYTMVTSSPGVRAYATSNPTRPGGWFHESQTKIAGSVWCTFAINCEDVAKSNWLLPNGEYVWPYIATPDYIADMKRTFEGKPLEYGIRVKGEFPKLSSNGLNPAEVVEAAQARWTETPGPADEWQPLVIGIDCAHYGEDRTVFVARRGRWTSRPFVCPPKTDSVDGARLAKEFMQSMQHHPAEPCRFQIDTTSNGGLADNLEHDPEVMKCATVKRLGFAADPMNDPSGVQCHRMRDRLWCDGSEWLRTGAICSDRGIAEELCEPRQFFNKLGRLEVESKKDVKRRLGRSPDEGDAFNLAAFEPPPEPTAHWDPSWSSGPNADTYG